MLGSCFRRAIQKLAILKLRQLHKDETYPIAIPAVEFRIEAWHYWNFDIALFERWYFLGFQKKLWRKVFEESLSICSDEAQLYRSHRLFLCTHCKIKEKKAYLVINKCNPAILDHRLFPEANSYSFLSSFLLYLLPPLSLLPPFLSSSFPHSLHFFLVFFYNNLFTSSHQYGVPFPRTILRLSNPRPYTQLLSFLSLIYSHCRFILTSLQPRKQPFYYLNYPLSVHPFIIHHSTLSHTTQVIQ